MAFIVPPVPYYSTLLYTGPLGLYKGLQWLLGSGKLWNSRSSPSCADTETDNNNHARTCGLDGSLIKVKRGIKCGRKNGERIAAVRVRLRPGSCFPTSSCGSSAFGHRWWSSRTPSTIYHPPTHRLGSTPDPVALGVVNRSSFTTLAAPPVGGRRPAFCTGALGAACVPPRRSALGSVQ